MKAFCYAGSAACIALFWFNKDNIEFGIIAFAIAAFRLSGAALYFIILICLT